MAAKHQTKPARETDLYGPVRDYLVAQGYAVRAEVNHCDITARKGDDLIVIELKRRFGVDLLLQATERRTISESIYVALPRPDVVNPRWRGIKKLLRRLELGLIFVSFNGWAPRVEVVFHPMANRPRKLKRQRRAVIVEMESRSGDYNEGGSTRRKIVTAYRETAIHIACCLERLGPLAPRRLRALGTGPKTLSILSNNHYGWFERVSLGVYALSAEGRAGLAEYTALAGQYREKVARAIEKA